MRPGDLSGAASPYRTWRQRGIIRRPAAAGALCPNPPAMMIPKPEPRLHYRSSASLTTSAGASRASSRLCTCQATPARQRVGPPSRSQAPVNLPTRPPQPANRPPSSRPLAGLLISRQPFLTLVVQGPSAPIATNHDPVTGPVHAALGLSASQHL